MVGWLVKTVGDKILPLTSVAFITGALIHPPLAPYYMYLLIISHHNARQGSEQTVTFVVRLLDPGTGHQLELLTAWVVKWTKLYIYLKLSL